MQKAAWIDSPERCCFDTLVEPGLGVQLHLWSRMQRPRVGKVSRPHMTILERFCDH